MANSFLPHGLQTARLLCPWYFPGKNTGVGCHFLLQGIFPSQELNLSLLHLGRYFIDWAIVPIISIMTTEVGKKGKFKKKIQKNLQNKSKRKNSKCFSWVTAVRILSFAGSHSPPHLPRMPSNTVLISGPSVGAAQILIWSCSSVFLPPTSPPIRTSMFSFVEALNDLLYIPQAQPA